VSSLWVRVWLMATAATEHTTHRMPMAISMPRLIDSGFRTSSALVVTHSNAL